MKKSGATYFDRIIVLRNPASTHADTIQKRIGKLAKIANVADFEIIDTLAGDRERNKTLLCKLEDKLGPRTLFCVAAGDGTINVVAETLLFDPRLHPEARKTVILPLWGGNANDLAHMLNGHGWQASLARILTHGTVVAMRPLSCTLTTQSGEAKTWAAVCYASFGASAYATRRLSEPSLRMRLATTIPGSRFGRELRTVIRAFIDAPLVTIEEGKQMREMYERVFIKGSRFAKVKGVSLKLTDPHFYHTVVHHKRVGSVFRHILELTSPGAVKRVAGNHASFTPQQNMWGQVDGEVFEVPAHTQVEVTLSKQPLYLLSTILR